MKIKMIKTDGSTLVATLFVSGVMGIVLASYLNLVANRNLATMRSLAWNSTMPAIEAGIEEALTHCYFNYVNSNLTAQSWSLSGGTYNKSRVLNGTRYEVSISGARPPVVTCRGYAALPLQTNEISRTVLVNTRADWMFARPLTVKGALKLNGNNTLTDSFDSEDPAHSDSGLYPTAPGKRKDNGDVATVSGITDIIVGGNANVYGRASTGPGGSMTLGPGGAVGSAAWQASNSGIEDGWFTDDMNMEFPDVVLPFSPPGMPLTPGIVGGTAYNAVLGSGTYQAVSINYSGSQKMIVTNNAVLYVTGNISFSGSAGIIIAPGGSLKIYCAGSLADFSGQGVANNTGSAFNFGYYGMPGNTGVSFVGGSGWAGTVYAPNAAFTAVGNGDFVGSIIAASATTTGNSGFHYDEALGRSGLFRGIVVTAWNEM
jgi:hypothetical protein